MTYNENGDAGIRQALVNRGVDTNTIDLDQNTGNITIAGQQGAAPSSVVDGVSYGNQQTIDQLTQQAYKQSGDELVSAAQYSAQSGFGNMVKWDQGSGTLSVGGTNITPVYVSEDGIAYVRKSEIETAMTLAKNSAGVTGDKEVLDEWRDKYNTDILNKQKEVDNFSYDPNTDKEYQAYAAYQMQQKQKLAQDAAAAAQDATGGYGAAAVNALADSLYSSQQDIASAIPTYAEQAYQRKVDALNNAITVGNNDYNKAYQANYDASERLQNALDSDYKRLQDEREWGLTKDAYDRNAAWEDEEHEQTRIENKSTNYRNSVDDERYADNADIQKRYNEASLRNAELTNESTLNSGILDLIQQMGKWSEDAAGHMGYTMPDGSFISALDIAAGNLPDDVYKNTYYYPAYYQQKGSSDASNESAWEWNNK